MTALIALLRDDACASCAPPEACASLRFCEGVNLNLTKEEDSGSIEQEDQFNTSQAISSEILLVTLYNYVPTYLLRTC